MTAASTTGHAVPARVWTGAVMDAKARRTLIRAAGTLAAAALIVTVALWFNAPSSARVEFDVACRSLVLPAGVQLNLNEQFAQLESAKLFGFDATLDRVQTIEHSATAAPLTLEHPGVALVAAGDAPPSYLAIVPEGALGTARLEAAAGASLSAPADGTLRIDAPGDAAVHLVVQSNGVVLEGERYQPADGGAEDGSVAWRATGAVPGLFVDARSRPTAQTPVRADLGFARAADEIALLAAPDGVPFMSTLRLDGATEPVLLLDGQPLAIADGRARDLTFAGGSGAITGVGLVLAPASRDEPRLRLTGWIETASVRHGRNEILPTWIEETLDTSNLERSVWITILGVLAVVLFKAVDGALNAVLKLWFTE